MPKTKFQEIIFTLITSGMMIYLMGVYNVSVNMGGLGAANFAIAIKTFPIKWMVGFLIALFIASKVARHYAFKVAIPEDRTIVKILCIQTFTVCTMVPLMSLVGVIMTKGITAQVFIWWIQAVVINFIVALPLQIFFVGPFCRRLFRHIFKDE